MGDISSNCCLSPEACMLGRWTFPFELVPSFRGTNPSFPGVGKNPSLISFFLGRRMVTSFRMDSFVDSWSGWWFQIFFIFIPTWGNDPIWRICFKWVETTNQWGIPGFPVKLMCTNFESFAGQEFQKNTPKTPEKRMKHNEWWPDEGNKNHMIFSEVFFLRCNHAPQKLSFCLLEACHFQMEKLHVGCGLQSEHFSASHVTFRGGYVYEYILIYIYIYVYIISFHCFVESCSPNSTMSWGWLHRSWDVGCRFFLCDNLRKVQRASTTFLNHPSCHSYHFENPRLLKSQICHYFLSTWDQYAQMAIGFCLGGVIQHRHIKSGQVISTSHDQKPLKGSFLERKWDPFREI